MAGLSLEESAIIERAYLIARRLEREHETPNVKGHASDVAYSIEKMCAIIMPNSHRILRRARAAG